MKDFKIRCSAISQIMGGTNDLTDNQIKTIEDYSSREKLTIKQAETLNNLIEKRDTPPPLLQTAKTYCDNWIKEQLYNRRKEFTSKMTDKGLIMEDNSIDFIADQLGYGFLIKNEEYFPGKFMHGTPDVILPDTVIDVKNSWDCFTFPLLDDEIPNNAYWWQGQGYMHLTGRKHYKLIYVLSDTPEHLIAREAYWYAKNNGYEEVSTEIFNEFMDKMTYSDIPDKYKLKKFEFDYEPEAIEKIESQVIKCRNYINSKIANL